MKPSLMTLSFWMYGLVECENDKGRVEISKGIGFELVPRTGSTLMTKCKTMPEI